MSVQGPWPRMDLRLRDRTLSVRHAAGATPGLPPALYVHGLGGSALNWTDLMGELDTEVEGWAVDLGGFGASPPPRDGDLSPKGHARSLEDLIEYLDRGPVHLFGNSLGGAISLQLAARRPDLVRSLTLIAPALPAVYPTRSNVHLPVVAFPGVGERVIPRFLASGAEERVRGTLQVVCADPSRIPPQRLAEAIEEVVERDGLPYAGDSFLRSLRGLLRTYLQRGAGRPWKLAEQVTAPTLLIYGRKDPLVDARAAYRATRHFRHATVVVLPDSGHSPQMEHAEIVAQVWSQFMR